MNGEDSFKVIWTASHSISEKIQEPEFNIKKQCKITFNVNISKASTITLTEGERKRKVERETFLLQKCKEKTKFEDAVRDQKRKTIERESFTEDK